MEGDVSIRDRAGAARLFAGIADATEEICAFAFLDSGGRLLGMRFSPGGAHAATVPIRAVAADAIAFDAASVVMAHNHPSGDPRPSADDLAITRRLSRALDALGVRLSEHLVLAGGLVVSLREAGVL